MRINVCTGHCLLDDRVSNLLMPHEQGDLLLAANVAYLIGFEYLSWVYLMELMGREHVQSNRA